MTARDDIRDAAVKRAAKALEDYGGEDELAERAVDASGLIEQLIATMWEIQRQADELREQSRNHPG